MKKDQQPSAFRKKIIEQNKVKGISCMKCGSFTLVEQQLLYLKCLECGFENSKNAYTRKSQKMNSSFSLPLREYIINTTLGIVYITATSESNAWQKYVTTADLPIKDMFLSREDLIIRGFTKIERTKLSNVFLIL